MESRKGAEPVCMNCKKVIPGEEYGKHTFQKVIVPYIIHFLKGICDRKKEPCTVPDCTGFILGNFHKKCSMCNTKILKKDKDIQEEQDKFFLDKNFVACPECNVKIEKSHGCDHMFCVLCYTHFSNKTGKKIGIHANPEYFDFLDSLTLEEKERYREKYNNETQKENSKENSNEKYFIDLFLEKCKSNLEIKFLLKFQKKYSEILNEKEKQVYTQQYFSYYVSTKWDEETYLKHLLKRYLRNQAIQSFKLYLKQNIKQLEESQNVKNLFLFHRRNEKLYKTQIF